MNYAFLRYEQFDLPNSSYQTWPHPIIFTHFPSTGCHLCTLLNIYWTWNNWSGFLNKMHVLLLCPLGAVVLRFFKGDTLPFPVELPHHRYWSTQQGTVHIHLCVPWKKRQSINTKDRYNDMWHCSWTSINSNKSNFFLANKVHVMSS